jgi:hypothetical protein
LNANRKSLFKSNVLELFIEFFFQRYYNSSAFRLEVQKRIYKSIIKNNWGRIPIWLPIPRLLSRMSSVVVVVAVAVAAAVLMAHQSRQLSS